jgi:hypothetical protein
LIRYYSAPGGCFHIAGRVILKWAAIMELELLNNNLDDTEIKSPTWEQVQSALYRLDGDELNNIGLRILEKGTLICGGGDLGERRYVLIYQPEDDGQAVTLYDPALGDENELEVTIQSTEKLCVRLDMIIKAFKHFYQKGVLTDELCWE